MRERFLVDSDLQAGLARAGVSCAADLFALAAAPDTHSVGAFVELPIPQTSGRFYLKRYVYPSWRASWGLLGRGTLWGRAPEINEFLSLQWLRAHDLPAVRPVAAAARTSGVRLAGHALLTEAVPDTIDLDTRLHTPGDPLRDSRVARRRLARDLGGILRRMHALRFVHSDCHARNVLVRMDGDFARFWLLDCRRAAVGGRRRGPEFDLACLDRDLRGVLTRGERRHALAAYLGSEGDAGAAVARIAAARARLGGARRAPSPASGG